MGLTINTPFNVPQGWIDGSAAHRSRGAAKDGEQCKRLVTGDQWVDGVDRVRTGQVRQLGR